MKYKNIIIFISAVICLIAAIFFLSDDLLTPYVPFEKAKSSIGKVVQIIGKLDKAKPVQYTGQSYTFSVIDKSNSKMNVIHNGTKPLNFEHADQIVIIGEYDLKSDLFKADKVLIKCPSKYQKGK